MQFPLITAVYETRTYGGVRGALRQFLAEPSTRLCLRCFFFCPCGRADTLFARRFKGLNEKFENIYLIRNEREIKIFDKLGRAFEPDFLLFCKQRDGEQMTFQVFIEPKGAHLIANDKWKEDFLKEIRAEQKTIEIHTDTYLITAVPFYNYANENEFKTTLESTLNE